MNKTLANFSEVFAALYIFLMIASITGNLVCLFGLTRKYHKRRFRDHFFISMVICDLLRISLTGPMEIRGLMQQQVTDESFCIGFSFIMSLFEFTSISHLLLVVMDRYICVCKPTLALKLYLQPTTIYKAILLSYLYGLFWSVLPLFGLGEFGFQIGELQCGLKPKHDIASKVYILLVLLIAYIVPVGITIWCFFHVWKRTKTNNNGVVTVSDESQDQKDLRKYFSSDRKQFQLILALILTFIFTWFVYDLTMFEEIYIAQEANAYAEIVTTFIGQSSALITPLAILAFYTDLQKTFMKFLGKKRAENTSVTKSRASTRVVPIAGSVETPSAT
ncbi:melanopsin-A-like [Clytia hemisphaerica]|eukprot:TCONS_00035179-protein